MIVGTATLRPPGSVHGSLRDLLLAGLPRFVLRRGLRPIRRDQALSRAFEAVDAEIAGERPHGYLHMMAVAPGLQGRGLGSALLGHALSQTTHESALSVTLQTQKPENLAFYARAGFELVDTREMPSADAQEPYTTWSMIRRGEADYGAVCGPAGP